MKYEKFTAFYDPNRRAQNNDELVAALIEAKQSTPPPNYLHATDGVGLLFAEATHLGLEPHQIPISIDERQKRYIMNQIGAFTTRIFRATERSARELQPECPELTPVLAGAALGLYAHYDTFRGNGKPYITHPQAVAKQIEVVQKHYNFLSEHELQSNLFLALTHDAFEDAVPIDQGATFLTSEHFCVSPRISERLFEQNNWARGNDIGHSLFLMSKSTGFDGKMSYQSYIERGKNDRRFRTVKLADIHHNEHLDPKPAYTRSLEFSQKNYQKQRDYRFASRELLRSVDDDQTYDLKARIAHHAILALKTNDLQEFMPLSDSFTATKGNRVADIFASHLDELSTAQPS